MNSEQVVSSRAFMQKYINDTFEFARIRNEIEKILYCQKTAEVALFSSFVALLTPGRKINL